MVLPLSGRGRHFLALTNTVLVAKLVLLVSFSPRLLGCGHFGHSHRGLCHPSVSASCALPQFPQLGGDEAAQLPRLLEGAFVPLCLRAGSPAALARAQPGKQASWCCRAARAASPRPFLRPRQVVGICGGSGTGWQPGGLARWARFGGTGAGGPPVSAGAGEEVLVAPCHHAQPCRLLTTRS